MSLSHYLVGNEIAMVATFAVRDPITEVETPTDPTTITFRRKVGGVTTTYVWPVAEITNPDVGTYVCTVPLDDDGRERWRVEGTGVCVAAAEDAFDVDASVLA